LKPRGGTCNTTSDCAAGLTCSGGTCQTGSGGACTDTSQCASGFVCNGGQCLKPQGGTCSNTNECVSNTGCENGECRSNIGGNCVDNDDCLFPFICSGGQCAVDSCLVDADCRPGASCQNLTCVSPFQTGNCVYNEQCDGDQPIFNTWRCGVNGKCGQAGGTICDPGDPGACATGVCDDGSIIGPDGACTCRVTSDCVPPQTCVNNLCT